MKENIELTHPPGENVFFAAEVGIMLVIARKKEEDQILEEDIIVEEDIEADQEVIITEEDIQDREVLDQEVIEKEAIEDIEDIEAKVGVEEVEIVVFLEEAGKVKEAEIIGINRVGVIIVLIGVIQEVKEAIIVNNKIRKILRKMKKIIKMEMKI